MDIFANKKIDAQNPENPKLKVKCEIEKIQNHWDFSEKIFLVW